jgi:hypothetical protein
MILDFLIVDKNGFKDYTRISCAKSSSYNSFPGKAQALSEIFNMAGDVKL